MYIYTRCNFDNDNWNPFNITDTFENVYFYFLGSSVSSYMAKIEDLRKSEIIGNFTSNQFKSASKQIVCFY